MVLIWYGIGLDALALAVGLTLCTLGYWWSKQDGYKAGYLDGKAGAAQEQLAERETERHTARHARTRPRQDPPTPPAKTALVQDEPSPAERPPWYTPIPGPGQPQAGRDSGPGTLTMARIELPATTGEMAAITDEYIERMQTEEAEHRRTLTA